MDTYYHFLYYDNPKKDMSVIREYQDKDARQVEECFVELDYERQMDAHLVNGRSIAAKYLEYMFTRCAETDGKAFVVEVVRL